MAIREPKTYLKEKFRTTPGEISDILRGYWLAYSLGHAEIPDLEIKEFKSGNRSIQYLFVLSRFGDYGLIGDLEISPLNDIEAWVEVRSYSGEGIWKAEEDARIFAPVNEFLFALADHLLQTFRVERQDAQPAESIGPSARKRAYRRSVALRVALALRLMETDHISEKMAAHKSRTTTESINIYRELSQVQKFLADFRSSPQEATKFRAFLNMQKPKGGSSASEQG